MGRAIIKIKDYYLEWSTIVDAPVTFGMLRDEFEEYHRNEYGRNGHRDFDARMERVEKFGSSYHQRMGMEDVVCGNRAGPGECELTLDEIYRAYCLRQPIAGWTVPVS